MALADLTGKICLITGSTSGIGLEAAVELARLGATVVMTARDPRKGEACLRDVQSRSGSKNVSLLRCDFSSQQSIRQIAAEFRAKFDRLDILVNNAGGVHEKRELSEDGIEMTFAVNHLGYFLLTNLLLDLLERSAPARIVNVSSRSHYQGTMDFDDLGFERGYSIMKAYGRSKLGNVLFTRELAKRLAGKGVTVNCLHPGVVATGIWANAPGWSKPFLAVYRRLFFIPAKEGAQTIIYLAASPEVAHTTGEYFDKNRTCRVAALARDEAVAKRLWDVSAALTKLAPAV